MAAIISIPNSPRAPSLTIDARCPDRSAGAALNHFFTLRKDFMINSTRRTSIATGALFIVATIAALAAASVVPSLTGTDYLTTVADQPNRLAAAALLYLIAAGSSVGIAIAFYPMLKQINTALALGSVVFRTIEAVFYTAAVVSLLSIPALGQEVATAPADDQAPIQAIAGALLSMREHATLVAVFAFTLGALMYYTLFYRARLVPRWLSGWGLAAALLMMTACLLALFSNSGVTGYTALILPIAVQEMVFAGWMLVKGFTPSPLPSGHRPKTQPLSAGTPQPCDPLPHQHRRDPPRPPALIRLVGAALDIGHDAQGGAVPASRSIRRRCDECGPLGPSTTPTPGPAHRW